MDLSIPNLRLKGIGILCSRLRDVRHFMNTIGHCGLVSQFNRNNSIIDCVISWRILGEHVYDSLF